MKSGAEVSQEQLRGQLHKLRLCRFRQHDSMEYPPSTTQRENGDELLAMHNLRAKVVSLRHVVRAQAETLEQALKMLNGHSSDVNTTLKQHQNAMISLLSESNEQSSGGLPVAPSSHASQQHHEIPSAPAVPQLHSSKNEKPMREMHREMQQHMLMHRTMSSHMEVQLAQYDGGGSICCFVFIFFVH